VKLLDARGFLAVLLAAVALTACGRTAPVRPRPTEGLEDVRAEAQSTAADVAELHTRVVRLERRLLRAQSAQRKLRHNVAAKRARLEKSVARLEETLAALRKKSSAAARGAAAAAEVAASAARDLTVLTRRFDYHLRHPGK
jgi:TolA-binding protein